MPAIIPDQPPSAGFDLHLHTCWSYDGLATPEAYFRAAQAQGVTCIAMTDHHVLDSLPEITACARRYPLVRFVPAAELTVTARFGTCDLLFYGLPAESAGDLSGVWRIYHEWQRACGAAISAAMHAIGLPFTDEDRLALLRRYRPARTIAVQGNTHVKNEMLRAYFLEQGFISSKDDYVPFLQRLRNARPFPPYPAADQVVPAVKRAGALLAIAHPFGYFQQYNEPRMDAIRCELGLDGIECAHGGIPPEYTEKYRRYCVRHGLFSVGGSDCHAEAHIPARFGRHYGRPEWLDEFLQRLETRVPKQG
ncbi:MAG: PHP domain-containing protein [Kiritimatiellae bacterium]|nr:PHP domain-containing protein [Kiritimatiellia bacterium]